MHFTAYRTAVKAAAGGQVGASYTNRHVARQCLLAFLGACGSVPTAQAQSADSFQQMSIEDLSRVSVISVSKTDQPLADAPAAIYVINHDQIARSGATTLPEMLRIAPNLQVYQQAPGKWVVTARGMNGNPAAQSFSNKLLVLVDGRSVYTPLYSGVYWDLPDIQPSDVDRIEVISGPGATLWGANAMNGVINVITRSADQTQGIAADLRAGSSRQAFGLRAGGRFGDNLAWRGGIRWIHEASGFTYSTLAPAGDEFRRLGANVRLDWTPSANDSLTVQGEMFGGRLGPAAAEHEDTSGGNVALRWERQGRSGDTLTIQAYYDRIARASKPSGGRFFTDTGDIDVQHSLNVGSRHRISWGGGIRVARYRIDGTPSFFFDPTSRDLLLVNGYVQDTFTITSALSLTTGLKLEKDPYVSSSLLPEARLAWKPDDHSLVWASVARAVRSPTPFDRDVEERAGMVTLSGDRAFRTEKLTAYELGLRMQPTREVSFTAATFYHNYTDLRTIELVPAPGFNLSWGNSLRGHSFGVDAWFEWQPAPWLTISGGMTLLKQKFHFAPGASEILGTSQLGSDPGHQFHLRSSINLPAQGQFDLAFRAVGPLPDPYLPGYRELDARVAWPLGKEMIFAIAGTNLLHSRHAEYPGADLIPRRVMAQLELTL